MILSDNFNDIAYALNLRVLIHVIERGYVYEELNQSKPYYEGRYAKFDLDSPFGSKAGFETNLGIVSIPDIPLHGYIYAGGYGNSTRWQLFAEAVYI